MTAFLPFQDTNPSEREQTLHAARQTYTYNYTHVSPLALVDRVPIHDEFTFGWLKTVAERVMVGLENMAFNEVEAEFKFHHLAKRRLFSRLLETGTAAIRGLKDLVGEALRLNPRIGALPVRPESLDDYRNLFHTIGLPPIAAEFGDDRVFAWMRVGGPNPVMLQRMTAPDPRFPVTNHHLERSVRGDSLEAAMDQGRLYLADYRLLDGAELGSYPHGQKYVYAPLAMFIADASTGELLPVAIQCKQDPGENNPIFTPADGYNWLIAKTNVEIADGNVHEAFTHLGRTHLFIEPFIVSTYRQLAPQHPVAQLLAPHFEGTLAINEAAWKHLIANKGAVEKLFGCSIKSARSLTVAGVQSLEVKRAMLPDTFAARGVDDKQTLSEYPYRDDALLYWDAIHQWVSDYVRLYYPSDQDVQRDVELSQWRRELTAQDGGRVSGLDSLSTVDELINTLTLILYTCSVQHAAVNFPQYDLMSYVPNMPLAAYSPPPTQTSGATMQDFLNMLPPMDMAELQMDLGYLLGTVHYTQLGQYKPFSDPRVAAPLQAFQNRLRAIGQSIAERNLRRRPYTFLNPTGVPQSINI